MQRHIVMFSGGVGSWAAAKLVAQKHGTENLILLFADTLIEDEDNYRFLIEAAENVGGELVIVRDGRSPWEIIKEKKYFNHRVAPCSKYLKQIPCREYVENFNPENVTLYVGIDFNEYDRMEGIKKGWNPYRVEAPLCWGDNWLDKEQIKEWAREENLRLPRLYDLGFSHSNCGGFCIRAGKGQFS